MSDTARLQWLCRRGMKELDLLLKNYLENNYPTASNSEQKAFKDILDMPDPELYDLILGRTEANDDDITKVVRFLKNSCKIK